MSTTLEDFSRATIKVEALRYCSSCAKMRRPDGGGQVQTTRNRRWMCQACYDRRQNRNKS